MMDSETKPLVGNNVNMAAPSAGKQRAMLIIVLMLQFFAFSYESCGYPFYPQIAIDKGLSSSEIGLVFAAYGAARFLSAPIAGSMVSY